MFDYSYFPLRRTVFASIITICLAFVLAPAHSIAAPDRQDSGGDTPTPIPTGEAPTEQPTEAPTDIALVPTVEAPAAETPEPTVEPTETPSPTEEPTDIPARKVAANPYLSSMLIGLISQYNAGGAEAAQNYAEKAGLILSDSNKRVEVVGMLAPATKPSAARRAIRKVHGKIEARSGKLIQMNVPIRALEKLAATGVFAGIREPMRPQAQAGSVDDEAVGNSVTGAQYWHDHGIDGTGVKVAILDLGFKDYALAAASGDLPPTTQMHIKSFRFDGDITGGGEDHGNQVAQIVHDMAPGAELWLVNFNTDVEYANAVDYLISQHVNIINMSAGWKIYGAADGTGYLQDVVQRADDAGILFVIAAGNLGSEPHIQDTYVPKITIPVSGTTGPQNFHEWAPNDVYDDITNWSTECPGGYYCWVQVSVSWNDYGDVAPRKDYDVYITRNGSVALDPFNGYQPVAGQASQANGYPWPIEYFGGYVQSGGNVAIVIQRVSSSTTDYFELYTDSYYTLEFSNPQGYGYSTISEPSDSPYSFTAGALDWYSPARLGTPDSYSSRGPINGPGGSAPTGAPSEIKPDIVAPACNSTTLANGNTGSTANDAYNGFCGTSAAAPHTAGAAALVWQLQNFTGTATNDTVRSYLETTADANDSTPGTKDNDWGWGKLTLDPASLTTITPCFLVDIATCAGDDGWPMFQNTVTHTGDGASTVPNAPVLAWSLPLNADVRSPVVSPTNADWASGPLVYAKAGRYLYAMTEDGNVAWAFDLGSSSTATGQGAPAVTDYDDNSTSPDTSDDSMYVWVGTADGYVYKLDGIDGDADGGTGGMQAVCQSADLGGDLSKASPVIGADGTVYFTEDGSPNDHLIAVNPDDCSQKWSVTLGPGAGTSSPAYWDAGTSLDAGDDRIFVGSDMLYAVSTRGGVYWAAKLRFGTDTTSTVPTTPIIVQKAVSAWDVYAINSLGDLYKIDAATLRPATSPIAATRAYDTPTAGTHTRGSLAAYEYDTGAHNSYLYWGQGAVLYRYNTNGSPTSLTLTGSLMDASPVVDPGGTVIIGSSDGKVNGINGTATPMSKLSSLNGWPLTAAISTAAGFAIAPDGTLLVPSTDDSLRAYDTAAPAYTGCPNCTADSTAQWPLFQHDVTSTGSSGAAVPLNPMLMWTYPSGGDVFPPVVSAQGFGGYTLGVAYYVAGGKLRAVDLETHATLWTYSLGTAGTPVGFAAPALAQDNNSVYGFQDGIVYVGAKDGILHAVNAITGVKLWAVKVGTNISKASPLIGADGSVYVTDDGTVDHLIAIGPQGTIRWTALTGAALGTSSPIYYDDNTAGDFTDDCVYVGGKALYGFKVIDGTPCAGWTTAGITLGASTTTLPSTPIFINNTIYALNNLGDLYHVGPDGNALGLEYDQVVSGTGLGSLAYDSGHGGLLYWAFGGKLYRHIPGSGTSSADIITLGGATGNATPLVDTDGNVFIGTSDFKLRTVDFDDLAPTVIYTSAGSMANAGALAVDGSGVVLWPSLDDNLRVFGLPDGACSTCSAAPGWPMLQQNGFHNPTVQTVGGAAIREVRQDTAPTATVRPPVVDTTNGNIYFVSGQYLVSRKIDSNKPAWTSGGIEKKYSLGPVVTAGFYGMPALGIDSNRPGDDQVIIYVGGSDGVLHAVSAKTGDAIWKVDVGNNISKASLAVSDGGFIFAVEDNASTTPDRLIAVNSKGAVKWAKPIGAGNGASSPAIFDGGSSSMAGDLVVVGNLGVYAFKTVDGSTNGDSLGVGGTGTAKFDSGITIVQGSPTVYYAVDTTGRLWRFNIDFSVVKLMYPAVAISGTVGRTGTPLSIPNCPTSGTHCIFWGTAGNRLFRYIDDDTNTVDPIPANGSVWLLGGAGDLGYTSPLFDDGGTVPIADDRTYVGSTDGKLYIIDPFATPLDLGTSIPTAGGSMAGSGAFDEASDTLFWPSQNGKIRVLQNSTSMATTSSNATGQWPMFQNAETHQGTNGASLPFSAIPPVSPIEQWAVFMAGDVRTPVISNPNQTFNGIDYDDGLAFVVSGHYLYVLDVKTHLVVKRWDLGATSGVTGFTAPAIAEYDPNNTPLDDTDDQFRIYVADKTGVVSAWGANSQVWSDTPFWSIKVGMNVSNASPLAGRNGLVYVVEDAAFDNLVAINVSNGAIAWKQQIGAGTGKVTPAYYDGITDIVIAGSDKLYWIDPMTGAPDTTKTCPLSGLPASTPLIANGNVYELTATARLYEIDVATGCTGNIAPDPVASLTGTVGTSSLAAYEYDLGSHYYYIYFAVANKLYRYDTGIGGPPQSLMLGTLTTNFTNSTPLVDANNNVYIGGADGKLYGVDGDSMLALTPAYSSTFDGTGWPKPIGTGTSTSSAAGSLAMDAHGYLYVGSLDDNLRRFGDAPSDCLSCKLYDVAPWPMFQHDAQHTGYSGNTPTNVDLTKGHALPLLTWSKSAVAPSTPPRTPVISPITTSHPQGVVYYTSGQYVIAADAATGTQLWKFDLTVSGTPSGGASPALMLKDPSGVGNDDDVVWVIIGAKDGNLYALNANASNPSGELVWKIDLGADISKSSPTIDAYGNIYITEDAAVDRLHAVYWNGTRKWTRTLSAGTGASSPALDLGSTMVFVGSGAQMFAFDTLTGTTATNWGSKTLVSLGLTGAVNTSPVVSPDDNRVWFLQNAGKLIYAPLLDASSMKYKSIVGVTGTVGDGVALAIQPNPYTTGNDHDYFLFETVGIHGYVWKWDTLNDLFSGQPTEPEVHWTFRGTVGTMSPVIDGNGWYYIVESSGYIDTIYRYGYPSPYSIKPSTMGTLTGGVVIGNNGYVFLPSRNGTLYVYKRPVN